jgi:hypothetical protein
MFVGKRTLALVSSFCYLAEGIHTLSSLQFCAGDIFSPVFLSSPLTFLSFFSLFQHQECKNTSNTILSRALTRLLETVLANPANRTQILLLLLWLLVPSMSEPAGKGPDKRPTVPPPPPSRSLWLVHMMLETVARIPHAAVASVCLVQVLSYRLLPHQIIHHKGRILCLRRWKLEIMHFANVSRNFSMEPNPYWESTVCST